MCPTIPEKNEKCVILTGAFKEFTGILISVSKDTGLVKLDNKNFQPIAINNLCKILSAQEICNFSIKSNTNIIINNNKPTKDILFIHPIQMFLNCFFEDCAMYLNTFFVYQYNIKKCIHKKSNCMHNLCNFCCKKFCNCVTLNEYYLFTKNTFIQLEEFLKYIDPTLQQMILLNDMPLNIVFKNQNHLEYSFPFKYKEITQDFIKIFFINFSGPLLGNFAFVIFIFQIEILHVEEGNSNILHQKYQLTLR